MFLSKNNKLFLLVLIFSFIACKSKELKTGNINYNRQAVDSIMKLHGPKIAILSCLRCDCFSDFYRKQFREQKSIKLEYALLADSACIELPFPTIQISQRLTDRISEDMYNLTLFKKQGDSILLYIVSTTESKKLDAITKKFFAQ